MIIFKAELFGKLDNLLRLLFDATNSKQFEVRLEDLDQVEMSQHELMLLEFISKVSDYMLLLNKGGYSQVDFNRIVTREEEIRNLVLSMGENLKYPRGGEA